MSSEDNLFSLRYDRENRNALLAVPKKGRLYEKCITMLAGAGLQYDRPHRLDVAHCTNLPLTIVFLPAADIATYVGEGNVDIGITGIDVVQESDVDVDQILV
jgi:ATP phosphoribosyltransferase